MVGSRAFQRIAVGVGLLESLIVASGALGPYDAYPGQPFGQKFLTVFLLPLTAGAIHVLFASLLKPRLGLPEGENHTDGTVQAIVAWVVAFLIAVHTLVLAVVVGVEAVQPWASRAVVVLLGATLVGIGNLLPRTRPNVAFGVRTARTLGDRQLWIITHRAGGYVAVAIGLVIAVAGVFVAGPNIPALAGGSCLTGLAILFTYYRWRVRA
jgi:hypothetical protein